MPTNTMVLTLGCGKFRIFDQVRPRSLPRCRDARVRLVCSAAAALALQEELKLVLISLRITQKHVTD
jgi:hypothetical protein